MRLKWFDQEGTDELKRMSRTFVRELSILTVFLTASVGISLMIPAQTADAQSRHLPFEGQAQYGGADSYREDTGKVSMMCDKYFADLLGYEKFYGARPASNDVIRATFMLDKLGCDIKARISGAYKNP